jgi:hypothetical protein
MAVISISDLKIYAINIAMMKMFDLKSGGSFLEVIEKLEI